MKRLVIELACAGGKYRVGLEDISKIYKIRKQRFPSIPKYQTKEKAIPETDEESDLKN